MLLKSKFNFLFKKEIVVGAVFLLGVIIGGVVVHHWDVSQESANKAMVQNLVRDSGAMYDIDSQMLQTYQAPYDMLGKCSTTNPSACDYSKIGNAFAQSFSKLNTLAGERIQLTKKIESYSGQFQAWTH